MEIPCELQIEPSGDVNIKADNIRKSRKRRRRTKKQAAPSQPLQNTDASEAPTKLRVPFVKKIIFGEDGAMQNSYTADNWNDVSDCTRRAKKRSGYVSFANIYAEEKFAPSESFTLDATNTGLRCNVVEREDAEFIHEIPVKYKKDRNLEVAVYSFPNDYETVVKYWYITLQQLHHFTEMNENQVLQDSESITCPQVEADNSSIAHEYPKDDELTTV
uniref:Uncharacterized protein n=1 Tax=Trichobilharzia regenti TaxID=157069 RepID=A0AA85IRP9_TRIRE|nr:unnamed protein product [Trichobilharzia regenti]